MGQISPVKRSQQCQLSGTNRSDRSITFSAPTEVGCDLSNLEPVGLIGTGLFGTALAERLLADGFPVVVYNRTRAKADPLLARGAKWSDNPLARVPASHLQPVHDGAGRTGSRPDGCAAACRAKSSSIRARAIHSKPSPWERVGRHRRELPRGALFRLERTNSQSPIDGARRR